MFARGSFGPALAGLALTLGLTMMAATWSGADKKYPQSAMDLPPLTVIQGGQERTISLSDAFDHHGGACPGATMGFMAVRYGLELLFPGETPNTEDVVIIGMAPGGPLDLLDLLMKGGDKANRTWPPAGITRSADNFVFQFLRKSTQQTATIRLQDGLWPEDWFELRDKHNDGTITEAEQKKRQQDRRAVIEGFPEKSFEELFGVPEVKTFIAWGHIVPGEMDRHIRDQRRAARGQGE